MTLSDVFAGLRANQRIGLLPFIPAGYPNLETTAQLLPALQAGGASAVEIGIPFSDPIADGPIIQEAFTHALAHKLRVRDVFQSIRQARPAVSIPLVAMVSYSVVFRYGTEKFIAEAAAAGFSGLILPDLPPPEAQAVCAKVRSGGLDTILLVSPTTSPQRRREVADLCSGFIYYLSVAGITGERDKLPPDLAENLRQLRQSTPKPVCVGFGISRPEHVRQLAGLADGAIVGSGFVRRIKEHFDKPAGEIGRAAEEYARQLLAGIV
jgi:tryptophan synthase alpha chain